MRGVAGRGEGEGVLDDSFSQFFLPFIFCSPPYFLRESEARWRQRPIDFYSAKPRITVRRFLSSFNRKERLVLSSFLSSAFAAYRRGSRCLLCRGCHRCRGASVDSIWVELPSHPHHLRGHPANRKEAGKRQFKLLPRDLLHLRDNLPRWILNWRYFEEKWWLSNDLYEKKKNKIKNIPWW